MNLKPWQEALVWVFALIVIGACRLATLERSPAWQVAVTFTVLTLMCVRIFVLLRRRP